MDFTILNKTVTLTAKRSSGKSILIKYLVEDAKKHKMFKKIFAICPTNITNEFYNSFIDEKCIYLKYDEEWVDLLVKKMSIINKGKTNQTADHVLLILDDCCSDTAFHHSPSIKQLFTRGRHSFISIIITCQYMHHIPPLCRSNADFVLTGQLNNQNIDLLCDEFRTNMSKKEFVAMYKRLTQNYSFLLINNTSVKNSDDLNSLYGSIKAEI